MKYGDYGLQNNKKSQDKGSKGEWYCPYCWNTGTEPSLSMCFGNWVICKDCIKDGLNCFEKSERLTINTCDLCMKSEQKVYINIKMEGNRNYACKSCLERADRLTSSK
ncbi:MAG TPA: hypothetical protein DCG19_10325 [Cryomorphaceae bacterium]|nr:hypothetical protein [Owenweeksia sp.]HAD97792.1 hypothetical protein [Cryomorphaceae bacterium]HBF18993.1 hypothetical protein [Cryomorphaceae bacterium]|tara:strand:+ start:504 stop:827 length:324 start_codon:yes stop_codon:yes gene_type:complete